MSESRIIRVEALARVERFFEALLQGRDHREAPDITARICGICPVAYLLGASQAMESVLGLEITPPIRALRRLIYCATMPSPWRRIIPISCAGRWPSRPPATACSK